MNGKKAKALRKLAAENARTPKGVGELRSLHPKGIIKSSPNPKFVEGWATGEPKEFKVLHPGTLAHKPASFGSLYRKLKAMSKKPGHYFSIGNEKVSVREFRNHYLQRG